MSAAPADPAERCDDDFDFEPIPGLPERLPEGERILWSGAPRFAAVALDVFHLRAIAIYAGLLLVWRVASGLHDGASLAAALTGAIALAAVFAVGIAILALLALATARTTRYTITNRRVVMRIGIALTMSINLPFKQVVSVDYRPAPFGTGAIALTLTQSGGLGYLVLWPHARPFKFSKPQPMLRGVADGERVARLLGHAIIASRSEGAPEIHVHGPRRAASASVAAQKDGAPVPA